MDWSTDILIAVTTVAFILVLYKKMRPHKNAPPSLPWLPIVGSLPFLSQLGTFHLCLTDKVKRYLNVYSFYAGQRYTVVLSGYDVIREALVKRSTEFAGRNKTYAEVHVWNPELKGIAFSQYSDYFQDLKKVSVTVMKKLGFRERTLMEITIHDELHDCIKSIKGQNGKTFDIKQTLRLSILNIIYGLMLGQRLKSDDSTVGYMKHWLHLYEKSLNPILDLFPIARYLPPFRKLLKDIKPEERKIKQFFSRLITEYKDCSDGRGGNFVMEFFKRVGDDFDQTELYFIMKDFLAGGANTGVTQILWDFIMITNHPKVQKRLQEEINSVVLRDRLPSLNDKLPYLEATILEVMRLKTITPLAVPHLTTCDTEVAGYFIPANAQVVVNLWSAHMDPKVWQNPEEFRPERFFNDSGEVVNRDLMIGFSLGKRSCPGEMLARHEIFLFLAALLQKFDFLPPVGRQIIPDHESVHLSYFPDSFEMRFIPRAS